MGKRSDYVKRPRDFYPTPYAAVEPLRGLLQPFTFCEPCAGDGRLVTHLEDICGALCPLATDIEPQADWVMQFDALNLSGMDVENCDYIVTNPPYTWSLLKPMMDLWIELRPTLLLLPADFMHNKRMKTYINLCEWVQSVGRVKWIEDSKMSGVDNYAWYMFNKNKDVGEPTHFYGRV